MASRNKWGIFTVFCLTVFVALIAIYWGNLAANLAEVIVGGIVVAGLALALRRIGKDAFIEDYGVPAEDQVIQLLLQFGRADADDLGVRMRPIRAGNLIVPLLESMARNKTLEPIYSSRAGFKPNKVPYRIA